MRNKSSDGLDVILHVLQHLVPRLGSNALEHGAATLVIGLKASSKGSRKSFHSKDQEVEDILNCLWEDYGQHKLMLRCLEQLNSTLNYRHAATVLLISLYHHLRKHGNAKNHLHSHDSELLAIGVTTEEVIENILGDAFHFDAYSSLICKETSTSEDRNAATEPIIPASY